MRITSRTIAKSLILTIFFFVALATFSLAHATVNDNVSGWMWSDTIGWISTNCTTDSTCGVSSYGVNVDASSGNFSGYAWSDNIGWIGFDPSAVAGCPSGSCQGHINLTQSSADYGKIKGWARACSVFQSGCAGALLSETGGWDGWISMSCVNTGSSSCGTSNYGFKVDDFSTGTITGFAWGSTVVGWIESDGTKIDLNPTSQYGVTLLPANTCPAGTSYVNWYLTGAPEFPVSCTFANTGAPGLPTDPIVLPNGIYSVGGFYSGPLAASTNYTYTISCTDSIGTVATDTKTLTVPATCPGQHCTSITVDPGVINIDSSGVTPSENTTLSYTLSNNTTVPTFWVSDWHEWASTGASILNGIFNPPNGPSSVTANTPITTQFSTTSNSGALPENVAYPVTLTVGRGVIPYCSIDVIVQTTSGLLCEDPNATNQGDPLPCEYAGATVTMSPYVDDCVAQGQTGNTLITVDISQVTNWANADVLCTATPALGSATSFMINSPSGGTPCSGSSCVDFDIPPGYGANGVWSYPQSGIAEGDYTLSCNYYPNGYPTSPTAFSSSTSLTIPEHCVDIVYTPDFTLGPNMCILENTGGVVTVSGQQYIDHCLDNGLYQNFADYQEPIPTAVGTYNYIAKCIGTVNTGNASVTRTKTVQVVSDLSECTPPKKPIFEEF